MTLPTPIYNLKEYPQVYEPSEDTFLFIDALEAELEFIKQLKPTNVVEVGSGNGIVISSLATVLKCNLFATDINPLACRATTKTATLNQVSVECLNMDLLNNFKDSLFDIILFNPPYVVTESAEITGHGLNRAWAGGCDGREIIDIFLSKLNRWLNDKGVCYMVAIKENKLDEIEGIVQKFEFKMEIVKKRKILGEELLILKFLRC